jgi:hypothetical protein
MLITFLLALIFFLMSIYKVNDVLSLNGQVYCEEKNCLIKYYLSSGINNNYDYVKINNVKYEVDNIEYGELNVDSNNNVYQEVTLKLADYSGNNNEIVNVLLYRNKEIILKKIWQIIVER